jgi:hypothetical protein
MHPMVLLCYEAQVEAHFIPFGVVLTLPQDRYTVCTECTMGSEFILDAPDGMWVMANLVLLRLEMVLVLLQDRVTVLQNIP